MIRFPQGQTIVKRQLRHHVRLVILLGAALTADVGSSSAQPNLDKPGMADGWTFFPGVTDPGAKFYVPNGLRLSKPAKGKEELVLIKYLQPRTKPYVVADVGGWPERVQGGILQFRCEGETPSTQKSFRFTPLVWKATELRTALTAPRCSCWETPATLAGMESISLSENDVNILRDKSTEVIIPLEFRGHLVYGGYVDVKQTRKFTIDPAQAGEAFKDVAGERKLLDTSDRAILAFVDACCARGVITPKLAPDSPDPLRKALFAVLRKELLVYHLALADGRVPLNYETAATATLSRIVVSLPAERINKKPWVMQMPPWAFQEIPVSLLKTRLFGARLVNKDVVFTTEGSPVKQTVFFESTAARRKEANFTELLVEVVYEEKQQNYKVSGVLSFQAEDNELQWSCQIRSPSKGALSYRVTAVGKNDTKTSAWLRVDNGFGSFSIPSAVVDLDPASFLVPAVETAPGKN
jgi:hypothetical protein